MTKYIFHATWLLLATFTISPLCLCFRSQTGNERYQYFSDGSSSLDVHEIVKRDVISSTEAASRSNKQLKYVAPANTTLVHAPSNASYTYNETSAENLNAHHLLGVNGTGQLNHDVNNKKKPLLQTSPNNPTSHSNNVPTLPVDTKTSTKTTKLDDDSADITISKFLDEAGLKRMLSNKNVTEKTDNHLYYNSTYMVNEKVGNHYWVNMSNNSDVKTNELLSRSHRRATTVKLSFDFPFYGHPVRNITIATGGFLYVGEYVHSWLAATQYIAPLMANFDTSISNSSFVRYLDNGTAFTVLWENVILQDHAKDGGFTFEVTLHQNGDIIFVYKQVPVVITNITDDMHPVKIGLSDAYIIDKTLFFVRKKTIYEYHRVNFQRDEIKNWTVIILNALPTCVGERDCNGCLTSDIDFECKWCEATRRCSTGLDRHRHDWLLKECHAQQISNVSQCAALASKTNNIVEDPDVLEDGPMEIPRIGNVETSKAIKGGDPSSGHVTNATVLLSMFLFVALAVAWGMYAYRNPHTPSGQLLIRYRPSQWSWKRGEARYTAATIHM